jgi:signal transduction histidine kinase
LYFLFISIVSGALWVAWKLLQQATMNTYSGIFATRIVRSLCDMLCLFLLLVLSSFWSSVLFSYYHLIVPAFIPPFGILVGAVATTLWEREREREEVFQTKLQAAEEKLEMAQERYESDLKRQEAEAKSREVLMDRQIRREFVRRINHDLNAPVSVLNWTLADLQSGEVPQEEVGDKIGRLVKNSDKLCELIDQLVQSYDYDAPVEEHAQSDVDLKKLVSDAIDLQQPLAKFSNCSLKADLPAQAAYVHANALELTRVIDNLVRNAIKHNPQGTNIEVSLGVNGSYYLLNIQDNGKGIAPEHLSHIFEAGYRINPQKVDGQGLGLDIVSSLVERMAGKIEVASVVNKGTTFTVKLPILENGDKKLDRGEAHD